MRPRIFRRIYRTYLLFMVLLAVALMVLFLRKDFRTTLLEWLRSYVEPDAVLFHDAENPTYRAMELPIEATITLAERVERNVEVG